MGLSAGFRTEEGHTVGLLWKVKVLRRVSPPFVLRQALESHLRVSTFDTQHPVSAEVPASDCQSGLQRIL